MPRLLILTGASGAGKTTLAQSFERQYPELAEVFGFDSVGVPGPEEMVRVHGSGENWQCSTMLWWAMRIAPVLVRGRNALLDGQVRRSFIVSGCEQAGIADYQPVLIDCSDQIRRTRLVGDRAQPELANPDMLRWADFLRKEAIGCGDPIIGTDNLSVNVAVELIRQMLVS